MIATATAGSTIPTFVIAPLFQLLFALTLKWLPVGGWGDGAFVNKIGPIVTLCLAADRHCRAPHARLDDRVPALASYPHRPRAWAFRLLDCHQPCAARRAIADHLLCRSCRGRLADWLDHRRNHFPDSRSRALFRRCRAQPRLHIGDGHGRASSPSSPSCSTSSSICSMPSSTRGCAMTDIVVMSPPAGPLALGRCLGQAEGKQGRRGERYLSHLHHARLPLWSVFHRPSVHDHLSELCSCAAKPLRPIPSPT